MFVESENSPAVKKSKQKRKSNIFQETEKTEDKETTPKKTKLENSSKKLVKNVSNSSKEVKSVKKSSTAKKKKDKKEKLKTDVEVKKEIDFVNMLLPSKNGFEEFKEDGSDSDGGEDDEDVGVREQLIEAMSSLDGKKKKILNSRGSNLKLTEDSAPAPEDRIELEDLLNSLDQNTRDLSKRSKGEKAASTLEAPLHRQAEERVTREAGYTRVRQQVNIWDSVVHANRTQESMEFPLDKPDLRMGTATEVVKTRFAPETPLELQVAAMLAGSAATPQPGEELSQLEMKALQGLTVKEMKMRRAELAKFRALQSYQEAKFKRQNKIKSKSYRKLIRKIKNKEKLKELERLAETDPQAAAEHIEMLNRRRIEERATLKHRNASRFMQEQAKRAKLTKDKDLQGQLQEQLAKHRELVAKPKLVSDDENEDDESSDEEEEPDLDLSKLAAAAGHDTEEGESYKEFAAGYKKFWEAEQKAKQEQNKMMTAVDEIENMFDDAEHSRKQAELQKQKKNEKKKMKKKQNKENKSTENEEPDKNDNDTDDQDDVDDGDDVEADGDDELEHAQSINIDPQQKTVKSISGGGNKNGAGSRKGAAKPSADVDPEDFIVVKPKKLKSDLPEILGYNEEDETDEETENDQRKMIAEAFADDDVMEDFRKEKNKIIDESKPKDIDLTLPGWGEWGGGGLMPSQRKRKRFLIKAPPAEKRKDANKGHVIINTDKDKKLREHQVSRIPSHFSSVSDFEASIRAPLGDTFVPRTAFLKLVKPRVTTKMGKVIQPIDRSALLDKNKELVEELVVRK